MSSMRDSHVQHGRHICCRGWHVSEHERHIRDLHTGWRLVLYRVADRLAWRHVLETCSVDEELHELALDTARGASDGQVLWGCSSCCSPLGLLLMLGPVRHLCYSIHACTHTHTHTHTHTAAARRTASCRCLPFRVQALPRSHARDGGGVDEWIEGLGVYYLCHALALLFFLSLLFLFVLCVRVCTACVCVSVCTGVGGSDCVCLLLCINDICMHAHIHENIETCIHAPMHMDVCICTCTCTHLLLQALVFFAQRLGGFRLRGISVFVRDRTSAPRQRASIREYKHMHACMVAWQTV